MDQIHILVETETKKRLKLMGINVSEKVRDFLDTLASSSEKVDVINLEIKKIELERIEKELSNLQAKRNTLVSHIDQISRQKEEMQIKHLKAEEQRIKRATTCSICGHEPLKFSVVHELGNICKSCFLGGSTKARELLDSVMKYDKVLQEVKV